MTWTNHSFGSGMDVATADLARVTAELETTKVEQLGAALHARRKEKELCEQLKKQEA